MSIPKLDAAAILASIRTQQDPLWRWRQQFADEAAWREWLNTEEATFEITQTPEKGRNWWVEDLLTDNVRRNQLQALLQQLKDKHNGSTT